MAAERRAEVFRSDKDGQYYGRVVAANGRELVRTSEGYEHESDAQQALDSSAEIVQEIDGEPPADD